MFLLPHNNLKGDLLVMFKCSLEIEIKMRQTKKGASVIGSEVIKLFSCSTQLSMGFIMLINIKMPTNVGILTFISRINPT